LADHDSKVNIEKLALLKNGLNDCLKSAFSSYEKAHPQLGIDWLENLARHALQEHEEAVVFVASRDRNDFVAWPMKMNLLNGGAHSLSNFYTSTHSPIIHSNNPESLLLAIFQHLVTVEKSPFITLSPIDADSQIFQQVQHTLASSSWKGIHQFFCFGNWTHEVTGAGYESYLAERPSQLRNTISRRTRQFLDAGRGELEIIRGGAGLESAIEQFVSIYRKSWKQEEPFPEFVPRLLRLSANRGWLRLGIARYGGVPVAGQIWLVCADAAYIFKLAHDRAFKNFSPGTVLMAHIMMSAIDDDHVSRIDFLSGDDEYKMSWMSARKEFRGIAAYNPRSMRGRLLHLNHEIKRVIKKSLGRKSH